MRVAVLNWRDIHHPHAGGAEVVSHQQAKGLAARGHQVTLYAARFPGSSEEEWISGYRVLRQGDRFGVYPKSAARLLRQARTERPDVVLEHVTGLPWYAPLWAPAPTVSYFYHVIGPTYFQELAAPLAAIGWAAERFAPAVYRGRPSLCLGAGIRGVFESIGYHGPDFQLMPPGIETETYTPGGPKSATPSMVLVGRIMQYKRVDLAIRALAELHSEMPALRLHVLGPDPGGLREDLEARRSASGSATWSCSTGAFRTPRSAPCSARRGSTSFPPTRKAGASPSWKRRPAAPRRWARTSRGYPTRSSPGSPGPRSVTATRRTWPGCSGTCSTTRRDGARWRSRAESSSNRSRGRTT